jgi:glycosyltransferase involved in cell wall biosynthesis
LLNNKNGILIDPWDLAAISDAIIRAITDDELVDNAVQLNRKILKEKYDLKKGVLKLKEIYL